MTSKRADFEVNFKKICHAPSMLGAHASLVACNASVRMRFVSIRSQRFTMWQVLKHKTEIERTPDYCYIGDVKLNCRFFVV